METKIVKKIEAENDFLNRKTLFRTPMLKGYETGEGIIQKIK